MLFLSAQPDDIYFIWQLEVLIRNLSQLGISKKDIHIVIGFNPVIGLKKEFNQFVQDNHTFASFFLYPDTRSRNQYISTIRPHLLTKHWEQFPSLNNRIIFYHDSDIIFSRIPSVETDEINYVSDTRSYLDSNYVVKSTNKKILKKMCSIVGISEDTVIENDSHTGGAQYLLKHITKEFWEKVYEDSESIFCLLEDFNNDEQQKLIGNPEYMPKKVQAWCADMWAVLYNLWYFNKKVQIHPELDFCWPTDPIHDYHEKAILHYSGNHQERELFFYKRDYIQYAPWYDNNLYAIPDTNCSYPLIKHIKMRKQELDRDRIELRNSLFVIENTTESTFNKIKAYLLKHLDTEVIDAAEFSGDNREKTTIRIPGPVLIPIVSIMKIVEFPYTYYQFPVYYKIDQLFDTAFSKVLDGDILTQNIGKFSRYETATTIQKAEGSTTTDFQSLIQLEDPIFFLL